MSTRISHGLAALGAALALSVAADAQAPARRTESAPSERADAEAKYRSIEAELAQLRASGTDPRRAARLQADLELLARTVGAPTPPAQPGVVQSAGAAVQQLVGPACAGFTPVTTNFVGGGGALTDATVYVPSSFTAVVAGVDPFLWDVNVNTTLAHTFCEDLDITLTSPAGTIVRLSTDNGGVNDDVFNGTLWDDNTNDPATDHVYVNGLAATALSPEGRLQAFRGEDPNGVWTLTIVDDVAVDTGVLSAWSLDVVTLAAAPVPTVNNLTNSPGLAISAAGTPTVTDSIVAGGLGTYLSKVELFVQIPHTWSDDLDITLTSPAGTTVTVATDNAGGNDNVYNGTLFDPDHLMPATDFVYANNVVAVLLAPEGAFDNFLGQDPNGTWTLTVFDDTNTDGGTLVRWDLNITTIAQPSPSAPVNVAGTTGPVNDQGPIVTPTNFAVAVSGVGTVLWDLDLTTALAHTASGDLDVRITSPAGTTVVVSTDNGGTNDDVFNGTLWDDNANDLVADHLYTNGVAASPLTPEGRLAAFRGEDPNGTWTLTVTDDTIGQVGSLGGWSLDVSTLSAAATPVTTLASQSPGLAISAVGTPTVSDTMPIAGAGSAILSVRLYVEITHTWSDDLDISLTSPAGTVVAISTDNGADLNNVYNGTLFNPDVTDAVTDHAYVNLTAATPLGPEGAFDNFLGQDPNGNWVLTVFDDTNTDGGVLVRWDLEIDTCPANGSPLCSNGTLGVDHTTPCPCGNVGAPDRGCAHSFDVSGAKLDASGSIAADTVILHSGFEPAASFTLFMQHNAPGDTVFHDGVLCAGGTLTRLRGRNAGVSQFQPPGEAIFPNSNFANDATLTLSSRGGTFPGSGATMFYAAFYRNASTTFCPPATANVTNGWVITW